LVQVPEQHAAFDEHAWPFAVHAGDVAHRAAAHCPEQHCPLAEHPWPSGVQGAPALLELLAAALLLVLPVLVTATVPLPTAPPAPLVAGEVEPVEPPPPAPGAEPKRLASTPPHAWRMTATATRPRNTVGTATMRAKRRGARLQRARFPINLGMIRDSYAPRQGIEAERYFTAAGNAR
jgi:hypothetical protein